MEANQTENIIFFQLARVLATTQSKAKNRSCHHVAVIMGDGAARRQTGRRSRMWAGCGDPAPEPGALPEHIPHGPSLPLLLLTRRTCLARSCRQAVRSVRFDSLPTPLTSTPPPPTRPLPSDFGPKLTEFGNSNVFQLGLSQAHLQVLTRNFFSHFHFPSCL